MVGINFNIHAQTNNAVILLYSIIPIICPYFTLKVMCVESADTFINCSIFSADAVYSFNSSFSKSSIQQCHQFLNNTDFSHKTFGSNINSWKNYYGVSRIFKKPVTYVRRILNGLRSSRFIHTLECGLLDCCKPHSKWMPFDLPGFQHHLDRSLFGQHLATEIIGREVKRHLREPSPRKALVLQFIGASGVGKTFTSQMMAEQLFGDFVYHFIPSLDAPDRSNPQKYKESLRTWIEAKTRLCERSLFIFEDANEMAPELLNVLTPYLAGYSDIAGVTYRKSVFVFISNSGENEIDEYTLKNYRKGYQREEISHEELVTAITSAKDFLPTSESRLLATHQETGPLNYFISRVRNLFGFWAEQKKEDSLWQSDLMNKKLVDAIVPFLPLERGHVKDCIRASIRSKHLSSLREDDVERIASQLNYVPDNEPVFSAAGCKRVMDMMDLIVD